MTTHQYNGKKGAGDLTQTQKVAKLTSIFVQGGELTTSEVADMFGYESWQGAYWLLNNLACVLPLYKEPNIHNGHGSVGGKWKMLD